ncbi:MAG: translation initiation factor IF-2 N-terminal domain-containing protein, partial [Clostridia bacterium]|nr:translation initiation factor IF-2 N-terminal domain-containing protein [Clostridia bacterium]
MAKNDYKNVEKVRELLGEQQLGGLRKRLSSTEKSLNDILKKLNALEAQKAEREAAAAAAAAAELAAQEEAAVVEEVKAPEKAPTSVEEPEVKVEAKPEVKAETKPEAKVETTYTPAEPAKPAGPRAPRYFRNGQVQGEYVAKPGAESSTSTYRPARPAGERPARPQGEKPYGARGEKPATQGAGTRPSRPQGGGVVAPAPATIHKDNKQSTQKKKTYTEKTYSEKKPMSKRTLQKQQGMTVADFDEDKSGYRKMRTPKKQKTQEIQTVKIDHAVVTTEDIPLKVLSEKLGVTAVEISKRLFKMGIMKGINDSIDYENAALMAADMEIDVEYKPEKTADDVLQENVTEEDASK